MKQKDFSNKGIMKRLDDLEKRNTEMSAIFLLYSLAVALVIGYYSTYNILNIFFGVVCYATGALLSIRHKIKLL